MSPSSVPTANPHRFAPASSEEDVVFGACAPGWHTAADHDRALEDWLTFVERAGVERVCSLLPAQEDGRYGDVLDRYRAEFGDDSVRHAPLVDRHLADESVLRDDVLPFLDDAADAGERVVVHCLAGLGRTGQVLAAWLVHHHGYAPESAVETAESMGRVLMEPVKAGTATEEELYDLLASLA